MSNVFPIAYFGSISYFQQIVRSKQIIFELNETYEKQTSRNRTTIYSSNGKLDLSIPVKKIFGNKTITKDIQISYDEDWVKKHWRALESAYMHAPYFEYYSQEVYQLISSKEKSLYYFNNTLFTSIIKWLGLDVYFEKTEKYVKIVENDQRKTDFYDLNNFHNREYYQVFSDKHGYIPNLSILDLLFHEGPMSRNYLYI